MIRALERILKSENLLAEDDRLVVGVSGGADSVALLHLLFELNQQCGWKLHLHVAHLNHMLRGQEADDDEAFVKTLAGQLSLPCTTDRRDVTAMAAQSSQTIEEAGRKERYAFFERACLQAGSEIVAVAHHADDQAETVLHRILRGTGLRGLASIPRERPLQPGSQVRLIRPLLHISRDELLDYLRSRDISYRHDRSNESTEPTRNWIRIHLLPLIRAELNPKADAAILRLAQQAADLKGATDDLVTRTLESLLVEQTETTLSLSADALARKSRYLQAAIVANVCAAMGVREKKLSSTHLNAILKLINDPHAHGAVSLPGGWRFERRLHELVLTNSHKELSVRPQPAPAPLAIPGVTVFPHLSLELAAHLSAGVEENSADTAEHQDPHFQSLDYDTLKLPLVVRTRVKGDHFHPLGAPGPKSISDFMIDQKIERSRRDSIPIICDQQGPVWIVGYRIDNRVKLTPKTNRILRMEVQIKG